MDQADLKVGLRRLTPADVKWLVADQTLGKFGAQVTSLDLSRCPVGRVELRQGTVEVPVVEGAVALFNGRWAEIASVRNASLFSESDDSIEVTMTWVDLSLIHI